ncbi:hypothetical protein C8J56DRAFT_933651 [Mycena floridula]|nr:hypothetical protein C8J56DRAFT_933651 [Mycena floridula]
MTAHTILLTGGTGTTATLIAQKLVAQGQSVLLTSRKGQEGVPAPFKGVTFDWDDESTWTNPFKVAESQIYRVYLVAPPFRLDAAQLVIRFIELAKDHGVKRFVALSASGIPKGGPGHGKTHQYLAESGMKYCIIRPSWFFDNFLDKQAFPGLFSGDCITTATGDGKLGFVSPEDIADVAVEALTDQVSHNTDHIIVGPELLSFGDIADQMSEVLGRPITYKQVSEEQRKLDRLALGMNPIFATVMADVEGYIAAGSEEKIYSTADKIGKQRFKDFCEAHKDVWAKTD